MSSTNRTWLKASIRRWVGWLILATIFAVACVFLSNWQLDRRDQAIARINLVLANYDQEPIALADLAADKKFRPQDEWRPVKISGSYLPDASFLVRNRPYSGSPGFIQLAAFEAVDGSIYAIDRGWLPTGSSQDSPDLIPALPAGQIELIGRIRPTEPTLDRNAPLGQLPTINSLEMAKQLNSANGVVESFYLRMFQESVKSDSYPAQMAKPALDEGNHLSYAIQWIVFGLMAFAALVWAVRQERQAIRLLNDPSFKPKSRKRVGDDDKSFEDSL